MGLTVRNPRNSTGGAVFRRLDRLNRSESAPTRRARSPNYRGYWATVLSPLPQDANHPRCIWYSSLVRTVRPSGGMADAEVSKTSEGNLVWVRPPPRAPVALSASRGGQWRVVSVETHVSQIGRCTGRIAAVLSHLREHAKWGLSPPPERRPRGSCLVRQSLLTTQAWVALVSRRLCVIGSYFCSRRQASQREEGVER